MENINEIVNSIELVHEPELLHGYNGPDWETSWYIKFNEDEYTHICLFTDDDEEVEDYEVYECCGIFVPGFEEAAIEGTYDECQEFVKALHEALMVKWNAQVEAETIKKNNDIETARSEFHNSWNDIAAENVYSQIADFDYKKEEVEKFRVRVENNFQRFMDSCEIVWKKNSEVEKYYTWDNFLNCEGCIAYLMGYLF